MSVISIQDLELTEDYSQQNLKEVENLVNRLRLIFGDYPKIKISAIESREDSADVGFQLFKPGVTAVKHFVRLISDDYNLWHVNLQEYKIEIYSLDEKYVRYRKTKLFS